jgi:sigma-B regulation protein RsbU (phosphoserine phosphatase)
MLDLNDLYHLPQIDGLITRLVTGSPGLIAVAGPDGRLPADTPPGSGFLPSGRSAVFSMLVEKTLAAHPGGRVYVVAQDKDFWRVPHALKRRVEYLLAQSPLSYTDCLAEVLRIRPAILVIDWLNEQSAALALEIGHSGTRVISQLETIFTGSAVVRHLLDLGAQPGQLSGLKGVLSVQRMPRLCSSCKQPVLPDPDQVARLRDHYPDLAELLRHKGPLLHDHHGVVAKREESISSSESNGGAEHERSDQTDSIGEIGTFYQAAGCPACRQTGRLGDISVFDIFMPDPDQAGLLDKSSQLALETYLLYLASLGEVALTDFLDFHQDQFRRSFLLLQASERRQLETQTAFERKLAEQEAATKVLEQRTRSLISLQEIAQTLISSSGLDDLARRVCLSARELCNADRVILYYLHPDDGATVLSATGWEQSRLPGLLSREDVFIKGVYPEPLPFSHWPPGIPPRHPDVEGAKLRAGLYVPLVTQEQPVGLMVVHSTIKNHFTPGEVALIQAFANQAALAIQRAGLVDELRAKIGELQAAQGELIKKERLESELELARQVQQSMLPRAFPSIPGFQFSARSEPARQVGGDFYDVIELDGERFGLAIADVSDKGMPAALYMALTRSLLVAEARWGSSPGAVLHSINDLLLELAQPGMFVTMFYGVIDRHTGQMTYACAGHDLPILLREGHALELQASGHPLGLLEMDEFQLSEQCIGLHTGDRLVLYTDGLVDVVSPGGRLFDRAQLKTMLQDKAHLSLDEMNAAIFDELAIYQGGVEQYDDMTTLLVAVK